MEIKCRRCGTINHLRPAEPELIATSGQPENRLIMPTENDLPPLPPKAPCGTATVIAISRRYLDLRRSGGTKHALRRTYRYQELQE